MISLKKYYIKHRFLAVAHRGDSGNAPENTLSAYQKAIESGIPAIEVDVHLTKDNYVVAIHDDNLGRISNINKLISDCNYSDLLELEVGSWFDSKFKNEHIPTLEQVMELIHDKVYLVLELKPFSQRPNEFVQEVLKLIEKYKYAEKTIFVSFDYNLLKIIRKTNKYLNIGAIKIPDSNLLPTDLQYVSKCDVVICSINELDDNFNNNAKLNKISIAVYDVDTVELLEKAMNYRVQGIGTNYPEIILKKLKEKI